MPNSPFRSIYLGHALLTSCTNWWESRRIRTWELAFLCYTWRIRHMEILYLDRELWVQLKLLLEDCSTWIVLWMLTSQLDGGRWGSEREEVTRALTDRKLLQFSTWLGGESAGTQVIPSPLSAIRSPTSYFIDKLFAERWESWLEETCLGVVVLAGWKLAGDGWDGIADSPVSPTLLTFLLSNWHCYFCYLDGFCCLHIVWLKWH